MAERTTTPHDERNKAGRLRDLLPPFTAGQDTPEAVQDAAQRAAQTQHLASLELEVRRCLSALEMRRNDDASFPECLRRLQGECQVLL